MPYSFHPKPNVPLLPDTSYSKLVQLIPGQFVCPKRQVIVTGVSTLHFTLLSYARGINKGGCLSRTANNVMAQYEKYCIIRSPSTLIYKCIEKVKILQVLKMTATSNSRRHMRDGDRFRVQLSKNKNKKWRQVPAPHGDAKTCKTNYRPSPGNILLYI